jgi:hypothetical protein
MAMFLFILGTGTVCPVFGTTSREEAAAERNVLEQIRTDSGEGIDLFVSKVELGIKRRDQKLPVSAAFIANLLIGRDPRITMPRGRILIRNVVVSGTLDLRGQDIKYDVVLGACSFEDAVDFSDSHFAKGFFAWACDFKKSVDFTRATMTEAFFINQCTFQSGYTTFTRMQIDGGMVSSSKFRNDEVYFGVCRFEERWRSSGAVLTRPMFLSLTCELMAVSIFKDALSVSIRVLSRQKRFPGEMDRLVSMVLTSGIFF